MLNKTGVDYMSDYESEYDIYYNYLSNQFMKACPLPLLEGGNGQIRIKIHSEKGESNWINVSARQMKRIEDTMFETFEQTEE